MGTNRIEIIEGTTGLVWIYQLLDKDGDPIDLTNAANPTFAMRLRGDTVRKIDDAAAFIVNGPYAFLDGSTVTYSPTDGVLGYAPQDADVTPGGIYEGRYRVEINGKPIKGPSRDFIEIMIKSDF